MAPDSTDVAVAMDVEGDALAPKRVVLDSGTSISVEPLYGVKGTRRAPRSPACFSPRDATNPTRGVRAPRTWLTPVLPSPRRPHSRARARVDTRRGSAVLPARDGRAQDPAGLRVGRPHGRAGSGPAAADRAVGGRGAHLAPGHGAPRRVALRVRHAGHGVQGVRDAARAQDGHDVHVRPVPGARRRGRLRPLLARRRRPRVRRVRARAVRAALRAGVPDARGRDGERRLERRGRRTRRRFRRRFRREGKKRVKKVARRLGREIRPLRDHRDRLRGRAHARRRGVESAQGCGGCRVRGGLQPQEGEAPERHDAGLD